MWDCLEHPNTVPLLGITATPFQFIYVWMTGGELISLLGTVIMRHQMTRLLEASYRGSCRLVSSLSFLSLKTIPSGVRRLSAVPVGNRIM